MHWCYLKLFKYMPILASPSSFYEHYHSLFIPFLFHACHQYDPYICPTCASLQLMKAEHAIPSMNTAND